MGTHRHTESLTFALASSQLKKNKGLWREFLYLFPPYLLNLQSMIFVFKIFGSDRSPRTEDVCMSMHASVCAILRKRTLKGFLRAEHYLRELLRTSESSRESTWLKRELKKSLKESCKKLKRGIKREFKKRI